MGRQCDVQGPLPAASDLEAGSRRRVGGRFTAGYNAFFQNPDGYLSDQEVYRQELRLALLAEKECRLYVPPAGTPLIPLDADPDEVRDVIEGENLQLARRVRTLAEEADPLSAEGQGREGRSRKVVR